MNLIDIGKKYPSSKNVSGFIQLYEKYFEPFRNLEINILEIGIENGDSLRIWREYFPNANICGIDIVKKDFKIENTDILMGDQSDPKFLKHLLEELKEIEKFRLELSRNNEIVILELFKLFDYNENGAIDNVLNRLEELSLSYKKDGATRTV